MNVGDHVRALHSSDKGFITKIIDEKTIEIEIEDGFTILVLKKDVVTVKKEESHFFDKKNLDEAERSVIKDTIGQTGIFLAFIPSSENFVDLNIINNTDYLILMTAHAIEVKNDKGLFNETIKPKSYTLVNKWNIKNFDQWNDIIVDALYFQSQSTSYKPPLSKKIKFQAKSFFNSFKQVPVIDQKGYLYQIDENTKKITSTIMSTDLADEFKSIETPESIIDLHAAQLPNTQNIPDREILRHQLQVFQQKLDAAIANNMSEITFIHGSGNGVLKAKIQKQLSQHPDIDYYQDAQKSKFGYGATYAKIK